MNPISTCHLYNTVINHKVLFDIKMIEYNFAFPDIAKEELA